VTVAAWIAQREPAPPAALAARLEALAREAPAGVALPVAMVELAGGALRRLLARGEEGREVALELLAIDALATYAFEAQGEEPGELDARCTWAMAALSRALERA